MMTTETTDNVETKPRITFSNYRVEYIAPDFSRGHSFEPRCAILADDAQFNGATVRVFDVPDPDESQREVAQFACDAMNQYEEFLTALRDCVESLRRLPDVEGAYRRTCITQAENVLDAIEEAPCTK